MNYLAHSKFTQKDLLAAIEEARNAEMSRNLPASTKCLEPFLEDFEPAAFLEQMNPLLRAEILRLCGFYISFYGKTNRRKDFQERGRNILTRAIEIFEDNDCADKSAEAKVMLALCYYNEGSIDESEAILETVEQQFAENQLHPVYLKIRINQMMKSSFTLEGASGLKIYEDVKVPMEFCADPRLQAMFHTQAGIIFQICHKIEVAAFHYVEAIRFARLVNNKLFIAANLNNLSLFHKEAGNFEAAYKAISESIGLYEELNEFGHLPHAWDSYALTLLADEKTNEALAVIEKAVAAFNQTEDYSGWVQALWTKMLICLRLNDKINALESFCELVEIARTRINQATVTRYTHQFSKLIYFKDESSLKNQTQSFRREIVRDAIISTDLKIVGAAKRLGIAHQSLVEMLDVNFPDLRDELGIKNRSQRSDSKSKNVAGSSATAKKLSSSALAREIRPFEFPANAAVEGVEISDEIIPFFIPKKKFAQFASATAAKDTIVLVKKSEYKKEKPFLILCNQTKAFDCGIADIDALTGFFYLINEDADPVPFSKEEFFIVGEIVAFCRAVSPRGEDAVFVFEKWTEF